MTAGRGGSALGIGGAALALVGAFAQPAVAECFSQTLGGETYVACSGVVTLLPQSPGPAASPQGAPGKVDSAGETGLPPAGKSAQTIDPLPAAPAPER